MQVPGHAGFARGHMTFQYNPELFHLGLYTLPVYVKSTNASQSFIACHFCNKDRVAFNWYKCFITQVES